MPSISVEIHLPISSSILQEFIKLDFHVGKTALMADLEVILLLHATYFANSYLLRRQILIQIILFYQIGCNVLVR
jgi:hypothetical protein